MKRFVFALGLLFSLGAARAEVSGAQLCIDSIPFSPSNLGAMMNCLQSVGVATGASVSSAATTTDSSLLDGSASSTASTGTVSLDQLESALQQATTSTTATATATTGTTSTSPLILQLEQNIAALQQRVSQEQQNLTLAQMLYAQNPSSSSVAQLAIAQNQAQLQSDTQQLSQLQSLGAMLVSSGGNIDANTAAALSTMLAQSTLAQSQSAPAAWSQSPLGSSTLGNTNPSRLAQLLSALEATGTTGTTSAVGY